MVPDGVRNGAEYGDLLPASAPLPGSPRRRSGCAGFVVPGQEPGPDPYRPGRPRWGVRNGRSPDARCAMGPAAHVSRDSRQREVPFRRSGAGSAAQEARRRSPAPHPKMATQAHAHLPRPAYKEPPTHAPNAALMIDFDNVTMGIRSDLQTELKRLLQSDIIRGKVAVQRAYADWRRYPQYIVPLSESSIDLIFAPAYGSSKKNATDIRLAIDALELVFTRPEIGTFILLSGDSAFSSLVLKLKEYGKYVIGVGIRESTSDLLVQNCDEYYSYSALTGLTRAGDEGPAVRLDPWEVVERAVQQMAEDGDVMRSDRLKQVMLQIDPNFDETDHGYSKFNKFVQDAAERGLVSLKKLENGQYEVAPTAPGESNARREAASRAGERDRERERRRRRDVARDERQSAGIDEVHERAREERTRDEHPREERPREERPREERPREERPREER